MIPFSTVNKWSLKSRNIGQFTESIGKVSLFLKTFFTESYHFLKFGCPWNFWDFSEISAFPLVCIYSDWICQKQSLEVIYKKSCKNFAIFTGNHLCWILFLIRLQSWRTATLLKKTSKQVFSCEYCEISKNTYFWNYLRTAALELLHFVVQSQIVPDEVIFTLTK